MGILEWLGLRKAQEKPAGAGKGEPGTFTSTGTEKPAIPPHLQTPPKFQKPSDWRLPREDLRFLSDSEKINYILQGVFSIYEELKPLADDGTRVSRLQLLLENLTPYERELARKTIEDLDIDNAVIKFLDYPKSIEEISDNIRKSYGYTAARLRHLRSIGKVARLRDPVTNKYKYTRLGEGAKEAPEIPQEPFEEPPTPGNPFSEEVLKESEPVPAASSGEKTDESANPVPSPDQ
ncbi:MAG: hypothetical protein V1820_01745 [archaeon]